MRTPLCDLLGIRYPILLAGMAGGPTTPELVAGVSRAGGLGTFGVHGMSVDAVRGAVRAARALTDAPIGVNVLLALPTDARSSPDEVRGALAPVRRELGLPDPDASSSPAPPPPSAHDLLGAALDEGASVISTGLGDPAPVVSLARDAGVPVISMVATVEDAVVAAASGADVLVAQGGEAGGHRSNFTLGPRGEVPLVGTMALVPQVVAAVDVPVVATGGIMNGAGLVAALALGAQGAQFGSRFLHAPESGVTAAYRDRLRTSRDTESRIITEFSGRPARGLPNRVLEALKAAGSPSLGYPRQSSAWADIRAENARRDEAEHTTLWAGQAASLAADGASAQDIVADIVREAREVIERLRSDSPNNRA